MKLIHGKKEADNKAELMKEVIDQTKDNFKNWLASSGLAVAELERILNGEGQFSFQRIGAEDGGQCVRIFCGEKQIGVDILYAPEGSDVYTPSEWALDVSFLLIYIGNNFAKGSRGTAYYSAVNDFISVGKDGLKELLK